jgi:hypothetical protein
VIPLVRGVCVGSFSTVGGVQSFPSMPTLHAILCLSILPDSTQMANLGFREVYETQRAVPVEKYLLIGGLSGEVEGTPPNTPRVGRQAVDRD